MTNFFETVKKKVNENGGLACVHFENDQQLVDFIKYNTNYKQSTLYLPKKIGAYTGEIYAAIYDTNKKLYSPTVTLPSELSWYMGMIIGFHGRNIKEVAKELGIKYIKDVVEQ